MISKPILLATSIILTVTGIFVASNIYTLIPIYGDIADSFNVNENYIVGGGSLFAFFYAAGLLYFGPASDTFGRRKIIIIGLLASALSTFAVGLSSSVETLYITRSIQGLTLGSFAPVAFAYSFDLFPPKKRTLLLVFINTGFLVAGILGQLLSSTITFYYQWSHAFYFFAICYFVLFLISYKILPSTSLPSKSRVSVIHIMKNLLKNGSLLKCYAITFTLLFSFVAFYDAIGRFFQGTREDLYILRAVGLFGAVLSLFTGRLIDRIGIYANMKLGFILGIFSIINMAVFRSTPALMAFSILFVASISLLVPTVITLIGLIAGTDRAKALSLYSFILLTGASLASPVVMVLQYEYVLQLLLAFFLMNMVLGYFLSKETALSPQSE
ncbi:putative MFS family arabinose efflux permease [Cytobacillus oceanisediminis]|uniref:Putative MFS family arabinose efflux permease n=1 Tax=Cytobacillus oceanisediminis TaxID=665099 RepID=A0A2V2ZTQ2_9BACI|nr:MFS transporter [Cytobacillus oceanisediminis]PWW27755.1 putative MFS family arabinose efflux permease [Cytobacillus oceanisediminis]